MLPRKCGCTESFAPLPLAYINSFYDITMKKGKDQESISQVPHLTQNTNGKVTNSQQDIMSYNPLPCDNWTALIPNDFDWECNDSLVEGWT